MRTIQRKQVGQVLENALIIDPRSWKRRLVTYGQVYVSLKKISIEGAMLFRSRKKLRLTLESKLGTISLIFEHYARRYQQKGGYIF